MLLSIMAPERHDEQGLTRRRESDACWTAACERFLLATPVGLRQATERSLGNLHSAGSGLRAWVAAIAWRGSRLPESLPAELVQVYLDDPEAIPLHDCEKCGIAIPVRPDRLNGSEAEPEQVYFTQCPVCAGRTGWFLYFSRQAEDNAATLSIQRRKPR